MKELAGIVLAATRHMAGTWDHIATAGMDNVDRAYPKRKELKLPFPALLTTTPPAAAATSS
jgi:hypothetical protein